MQEITNLKKLNLGLVLSGGGAKGAYEAGVITAIEVLGLSEYITAVSGTSIGAINAALMSSGKNGTVREAWEKTSFADYVSIEKRTFTKDDIISGAAGFLSSVLGGKTNIRNAKSVAKGLAASFDVSASSLTNIEGFLKRYIDPKRIINSDVDYFVCARDVNASVLEYSHLNKQSENDIFKCVMASAAVPFLYPPVAINGKHYADGGIADESSEKTCTIKDNTPVTPLKQRVFDALIIVYLRPDAEIKTKEDYPGTMIHIVPSETLEQIKI